MLKLVIVCVLGFFIFNATATEYPEKTSSGDYVVDEETRRNGIVAMKRLFETRTKERSLTCENYLAHCTEDKSYDYETSFFKILCEVGLKGYLCDNAKDGEAFAKLYDKVAAQIYDAARGRGPFSTTTTPPPPPPKPFPDYD